MEQWSLVVDGRAVAGVEVSRTFAERSRGLLGRDGLAGALLFERTSSIHTAGLRFPLDVAFCDRDRRVQAVRRMRPWRLSRLRLRTRSVLEAEAGAFERWGLRRGSVLALAAPGTDEGGR